MPSLARTAVHASAAAALTIASLAVATTSAVADPQQDEIDRVTKQVQHLQHRAEMTNDRFLALGDQIRDTKRDIRGLRNDVADQHKRFAKLRDDLGASMAADLSDTSFGLTGDLLTSDSPAQLLTSVTTQDSLQGSQSSLLQEYAETQRELDARRGQLKDALTSVQQSRSKMADERERLQRQVDARQDVLDGLEAAQQQAVLDALTTPGTEDGGGDSGDGTGDGSTDGGDTDDGGNGAPNIPDASPKAEIAIEFAYDQLGESYVYGATGPDTWDCSGLVQASWAAAGVSLPRSSSEQATMGVAVSMDDIQPGDLVHWPGHIGMYVGNGNFIHAPHTGDVVKISPIDYMGSPPDTIRRIG